MNRLLRALWRASIWHPDAIPSEEGRASRELKRYVLPTFDVLMIVMGLNAVRYGMPSFDLVYSPAIAVAAAWLLLAAGVLALAGISFPRLWIAEALGKLAMVVVLGGYAGALWALLLAGEWARAFVAAGLTAMIVLPMWNLARLGRERQGRRAQKTGGR
ncbi:MULTISPECIES: hypothetical protein [unclassified Microbacterium]|uniref:hypothetical protein n=1 Tax=Microbacterium TaxID=33882 RepID=UPI003B9F4969